MVKRYKAPHLHRLRKSAPRSQRQRAAAAESDEACAHIEYRTATACTKQHSHHER